MALRSARGATACGWASHLSVELQSSPPSPAADRQRKEACPPEGAAKREARCPPPRREPKSSVPSAWGYWDHHEQALFSLERKSLAQDSGPKTQCSLKETELRVLKGRGSLQENPCGRTRVQHVDKARDLAKAEVGCRGRWRVGSTVCFCGDTISRKSEEGVRISPRAISSVGG